ncbi:hypothetical protein BDA99DRAFT_492124 [Phascolomyces articulosus]|uniref:Elongation factor 1-gamma n=1 Tax=Phascolomyces articulosus TaxID=60185 RepID=A0AAD5KRG9_9FUNG|nr:hypothetical protein BDA99DRAFT_492124 [Phascolomyces articulosus]
MTLGVLKSYPNNPNVAKAQIAAAYVGLEYDFEDVPRDQYQTPGFLSNYPMGKVPVLASPEINLFESSAIGFYAASAKENSPILGLTHVDKALIFQWVLFAESELAANMREWVSPLRGTRPYVKPAVEGAADRVKRALGALNSVLESKTYLVGESVTYADICVVTSLVNLYSLVLDKPIRDQFKNVTRYYTTLINKELFKKYLGERPLCETPLKHTPPKKEKKPAAEKKAAAPPPKKKETPATPSDAGEESPKPAPKPKSALDLLPPSPLKLDDWKRMYSNNDTDVAMKWFWENFDPEGYSIWKVDYKYNDELTQVFMSNNLIGGFFARLERAHKYAFGTLVVTGTNNNNAISGYFVIRGQEVPFEIYDAADYESYNFVKVEPSQYDEKKDEIYKYMAWEVDGFADGKVFK